MPAQDEMPKTKVQTKRTSGLPPAGAYRFRVIEAKEREGAKGPYWAFTTAIVGDKYFNDTHVYVNISLSPQARWKMDEWLDAFKVPEEIEITGDYFLGQFFVGNLVHNEFEGTNPNTGEKQIRRNAQIDSFVPDKGNAPAPVVPTAVKANMGNAGDQSDAQADDQSVVDEDDQVDAPTGDPSPETIEPNAINRPNF